MKLLMIGRPSKMTDDVLAKLEQAFMDGHTDEEACLIAEIDHSTLYRYCQQEPDFARKKELLKNHPKLKARRNIIQQINEGNVELSKWYLERKAREEFSIKQEVTNEVKFSEKERINEIGDNIRAILEGRPANLNLDVNNHQA